MSTLAIKPWVEVAALHPDVLAENFSEDIFALDLGPLADGNANVPAVYRDAEHFFRVSYLTKGLRGLLQDVLSRLEGGAGNRVLKLMTPFTGDIRPTEKIIQYNCQRIARLCQPWAGAMLLQYAHYLSRAAFEHDFGQGIDPEPDSPAG